VVPIPQKYVDRLSTIRTFNEKAYDDDPEGAKESAKSRTHFWQVGIVMATSKPLGVGIKQYEAAYDRYDFLHGRYGHKRAIHSAHLQVLAELGFFGAFLWVLMFAWSYFSCMRVRARAAEDTLRPEQRRFLVTAANGLMASMAGFLIGGSFLSLAYNELTWLTFAMVAALDRLSVQAAEAPETEPVEVSVPEVPIAFRAVPSYSRSFRL